MRSLTKRSAWVIVILLSLAAIVLFTLLSDARSGRNVPATFIAYHLGLLGQVELGNCTLRLPTPWLPKLESYESMVIATKEVTFVNVDVPLRPGKENSVTFLAGRKPLPERYLEEVMNIGVHKVRFVAPELNDKVETRFAWLPAQELHVGSSDPALIRGALVAATISCRE